MGRMEKQRVVCLGVGGGSYLNFSIAFSNFCRFNTNGI